MLDELRREDFEPYIGQRMDVRVGEEIIALEVGSVAPIANPSPRKHPPFALILLARERYMPNQGVFHLAHPKLGEIELFMVPIGPKDGAMRYEVIFN